MIALLDATPERDARTDRAIINVMVVFVNCATMVWPLIRKIMSGKVSEYLEKVVGAWTFVHSNVILRSFLYAISCSPDDMLASTSLNMRIVRVVHALPECTCFMSDRFCGRKEQRMKIAVQKEKERSREERKKERAREKAQESKKREEEERGSVSTRLRDFDDLSPALLPATLVMHEHGVRCSVESNDQVFAEGPFNFFAGTQTSSSADAAATADYDSNRVTLFVNKDGVAGTRLIVVNKDGVAETRHFNFFKGAQASSSGGPPRPPPRSKSRPPTANDK